MNLVQKYGALENETSVDWAVEIEELSYSYPQSGVALDRVSFRMQKGRSLAFWDQTARKVHIVVALERSSLWRRVCSHNGRKVSKENLLWIRRNVGMVFQDQMISSSCRASGKM